MAEKRGIHPLNKKDGLPIMINVLIIRSLYYGMKDKNEEFIDKENQKGHKTKWQPVYDYVLKMSKSRYNRIQRGESFEITQEDTKKWAEQFRVDRKYFTKRKPVIFELPKEFEQLKINENDWKCYYDEVYGVGYDVEENDARRKRRADKIAKVLKELCERNWDEEKDNKNPIFRIWYLFKNHASYVPEMKLDIYMKLLNMTPYTQWKDDEIRKNLKEYKIILENHLHYIEALLILEELENPKEAEKSKEAEESKEAEKSKEAEESKEAEKSKE